MNFRFSPRLSGLIGNVGKFAGIDGSEDVFQHEGIPDWDVGKAQEDNPEPLDTDDDGKQLFKEDIIHFVLEELEKRRSERLPLEQQWTLNANFLAGNQYCDINIHRGEIEQIEPVYDWFERETFNRISPLVETRIANLKKIEFMMKVKPRTNELDDFAKAEVSTAILQHTQSVSEFEKKKNTMISWNELCGNCFWLTWWDKTKGEKYGSEMVNCRGEDGNMCTQERVYFEGDMDYGLITPYEIFPESVFKQGVRAQRSIILEQVMSIDDIYDLYGLKIEGTSVETFELTPLASGGGYGYESTVMTIGHRSVDDAAKVITYFERPNKKRPNGRMIIIVGEEHLVYYGEMPYSRIPIEQVICKEVPGQFFGKAVIEELIPYQRAYNGCINRIHEYIKRIAIGSYIVEEGSVDVDDYEENGCAPGSLLTYRPGATPPTPQPNGSLPPEIMTERYNIANDMEYIAGVSQLMVTGKAPSGITSGTALESLKDIDNTRLSLTGDYIRNSIKGLAQLWLEVYKEHATTKRVMNYVGSNNISNALVWSSDDINSYDIEFTTENELLTNEEVQRERFLEAFNMGLFTDAQGRISERVKKRALECMKIGNYSEIMSINSLQVQAAQRENEFFERGVIPKVSEFDEHVVHIEEHMRYILQMRFQVLKRRKPQLAAQIEQHIRDHKKIVAAEQQMNAGIRQ